MFKAEKEAGVHGVTERSRWGRSRWGRRLRRPQKEVAAAGHSLPQPPAPSRAVMLPCRSSQRRLPHLREKRGGGQQPRPRPAVRRQGRGPQPQCELHRAAPPPCTADLPAPFPSPPDPSAQAATRVPTEPSWSRSRSLASTWPFAARLLVFVSFQLSRPILRTDWWSPYLQAA